MKIQSHNILGNLQASFVVFLVALPLAMGVSIASGYPPVAGLITGIIGGIVVGLISGAPLQVSGAAAGLTVVVYQGVQEFGLEAMSLVIILAGVIQFITAVLRLGNLFQAVSPTVLYGMLAGIGVLIIAGQSKILMNDILSDLAAPKFALLIGVISILVMALWPKISKAKLALVPAPLMAVFVCSGIAAFSNFSIDFVQIPTDIFSSWTISTLNFSQILENPKIIFAAIQLALIASAESLLCAAAVDQMHFGPRAKFNKELAAQGIGNALCGVLNIIPMTGVIVRSSANLAAGATSRLSSILHGVWILLFVAIFPKVLSYIPVAALAGILIYTGIKLVSIKQMKSLYRYGKSELGIYLATVITIVSYDLLFGVILGLALSSINLLRRLSGLSISVQKDLTSDVLNVNVKGTATFLRLPKLVSALEKVPSGASVKLNTELRYIDPACNEHLKLWQKRHAQTGGNIEIQHFHSTG